MKQKIFIALLLLSILGTKAYAQDVDNEMQYRSSVQLQWKLNEKWKLEVEPQMRFDESFTLDKYQLNTELNYNFWKYLSVSGSYRFIVNPRETKDTEYFKRYALSLSAKEDFGDFTPSLRLRYSNDADDEVTDEKYLRFKTGVEYNIPKCKITPFVAIEAFQDLNDKELHKMRYSTGMSYKIKKNNYIKLDYRLDYYQQDYLNKHIINVAYKHKF